MTRDLFVVLSKRGSPKRPYWTVQLASIGALGRDSLFVAGNKKKARLDQIARNYARVLGVQLVVGYVQGRSLWETILEEVGP